MKKLTLKKVKSFCVSNKPIFETFVWFWGACFLMAGFFSIVVKTIA